jgi:hypothetical protein
VICTNCGKETDALKSIIVKGEIKSGCSFCLGSNLQKANDRSAKYYKQEQQRKFKRELVQHVDQREFIQVYGAEKAREKGFSDEDIRKYSI